MLFKISSKAGPPGKGEMASPALRSRNKNCWATLVWGLLILFNQANLNAAAILPFEFQQNQTPYNFSSAQGLPISSTINNPPGSDGRQPVSSENQSGSDLPATPGQFQGLVFFGAVPAPVDVDAHANSDLLQTGTTEFSSIVAQQMQLPTGKSNNEVIMVMRRAQVGAPYLSRQISFLFGSVIPVPDTDENGVLLTDIVKEQYWLAEPHTTTGHTNDTYYWSPHARSVYAVQPGPISITWKKALATTVQPEDYTPENYVVDGGHYFRLFTAHYIVSGSSVKRPRKIYWTEGIFQKMGKLVNVPAARVRSVHIVYNNNFPRTVTNEYVGPGETSPVEGTLNQELQELRTLWFDQQQGNIHAYNQEGRVFVELLGDTRSDGETRHQLGFEVVDVFKQINPYDMTIELGERITAPPNDVVTTLYPEPIVEIGANFAYSHNTPGGGALELYATRETVNLNDYLVHWMELGEVGLKWPSQFGRYNLVWPSDAAKYSHFVRPVVSTEAEAQETAVPVATTNVPVIEYQDDILNPRGKLTVNSKFYTFLSPDYPAHRTLLRLSSGDNVAFERIFSWLDANLKANNFAGSVATHLQDYNANSNGFDWQNPFTTPRVITQTVDVGQRIHPPSGEIGADGGGSYFAGYIRQSAGNHFNANAYIDPFESGPDEANQGAIIPVNAVPGANNLEVWWFRANNAVSAKGFKTIYWPSVLGRYTIQWPTVGPEIVLASNKGSAGSGIDDPLVALGTIYSQNNRNLPGYNPNEEHALMSGGVAFALRDDLNLTTGNGLNYSSDPFVLVDYKAADGRPAMAVYKILREKPEAGWVFDYILKAGSLLQPPMPLGLLPPPVEGSGITAINRNHETSGGDLPGAWDDSRDARGRFGHYKGFTFRDRKQGFWVYRGLHNGLPMLEAGAYDADSRTFTDPPSARALINNQFTYVVHASQQNSYLSLTCANLPSWLHLSGLTLSGIPQASDVGSQTLNLVVTNRFEGTAISRNLTIEVAMDGEVISQGPLHITSTNSYTGTVTEFVNRPPSLAHSPTSTNSFTMRFYYKTEPGFDWPGVSPVPPVGSIASYLLPNTSSNVVAGSSNATNSLEIVYRPVWPVTDPMDESRPVPTLPYGQTLTKPIAGLPGVRDFLTADILYQQSIAANIANEVVSAVLHDPTRQKISDLSAKNLTALPGGIQTDYYQGKYYFPQLPPHLVSRTFFDPNMGANGSLVFQGEFKDELAGEKYVLLNLLRGLDLAAVKNLCPTNDLDHLKWFQVVSNLTTRVETFRVSPTQPGVYIADSEVTATVGEMSVVNNPDTAVDSYALSATGPGHGYVTLIEGSGTAFTQPGDPVAMHIFKVGGGLYTGELKVITAPNPLSEQVTFQHTGDMAGRSDEYTYEWKIAPPTDGLPPRTDPTMSGYESLETGNDIIRYTLGGAGVQTLSDNYVVMRYRPTNPAHPLYSADSANAVWSDWTTPQLAEGWIKRVLAGINPFNQRTSDLFNNRVNTDASIIQEAGRRWEGDIALNADTLNNYGLIEIYETILRRGRALSIEAQPKINFGPANDALLLAAGYLNDLYMMLGNEAWADASNPTIGIGVNHTTYGDMATALFSFKGQEASLLEEELALMRGRDDFLQPNVQVAPFYNRLVWNYTRGIDSGEVIYVLNYDILDQNYDGIVDATDAAMLYPQAHGDAYGHFLTALKGYYSLLMNPDFDWLPRSEAVLVLGQPVSVDYLDERKFTAAAAAVARAGNAVFDLTWRKEYQPRHTAGWEHMSAVRVNSNRSFTTADGSSSTNSVRHWGLDHWATRTGQGAYLNWIVANSIVPSVDPNPSHEGIQRVDRSTVPELIELPATAESLQVAMDNAEGGLTPLGMPEGSMAFDLNPNHVVGGDYGTHFEQVYERAIVALKNAVLSFDDAKDVTRLMRMEENVLEDLRANVLEQEIAYTNALIEIYGTPYPDDVGPGKTYSQGYAGPDFLHYAYVDDPQLSFPIPSGNRNFTIDLRSRQFYEFGTAGSTNSVTLDPSAQALEIGQKILGSELVAPTIHFSFDKYGNFSKPSTWTGRRQSPGRLQEAIARILLTRNATMEALAKHQELLRRLDADVAYLKSKQDLDNFVHEWDIEVAGVKTAIASVKFLAEAVDIWSARGKSVLENATAAVEAAIPQSLIVGLAVGGDETSIARGALLAQHAAAQAAIAGWRGLVKIAQMGFTVAQESYVSLNEAKEIGPRTRNLQNQRLLVDLDALLGEVQTSLYTINQRIQELDDASSTYQEFIAKGDRLQAEREVFRQRSAALVQGYRTRDAAFRLFRSEKLERYKTLFDLAARYTFLAANAYDYETGMLNTDEGRSFLNRIINARALGVVRDGQPQYAGSDSGDPGLSSVLAEMKADWDVIKGRLGFNNPDAYGTTASLRTENYRILPGPDGLSNWQDVLRRSQKANLLDDQDVRRYCMQIALPDGLPVPGMVLEFSTTISPGFNVFGRQLAAGDHAYSSSSFATKIFAVGVALEGYRGMDNPAANASSIGSAGGSSPSDPDSWYLDPLSLSANPYVYLIPVGVDAMRSPPLGDVSTVRTWNVNDLAIPLPFNIGASDLATQNAYVSNDSLTEPLFTLRKHQAFRPVSNASLFSSSLYETGGTLRRSQYTNNRLVARSVWNTKWKLVIPAHTLLNYSKEGMDRFTKTVTDIKIHFVTYSHSGN